MRFQLKHILIAIGVIALLLALALAAFSPLIRLAREITAAQNQIINEFDHVSIRDAAISLLSDPSERYIDFADLPEPIAQTEPKSVYVTDGAVHIEYGGGFAHYGLIVDPNKRQSGNTTSISEEVYYEEKELVKDVYFYNTE